ncbi:MAG: tetratricopeptide repeat protein [Bacteroidota bacterium]
MTDRLHQLLHFLEKSPEDSFSLYSVAFEYVQLGQISQGLEYFLRLRQLHPDYVGLYYHLGKTYERLDQTEEAIEAYQAGIEVARSQKAQRPLSELQRALQQVEDEALWE